MEETKWNIDKIKRLKRMLLIQNNLIMLLLFSVFVYYVVTRESVFIFFSIICLFIWIVVAYTLYTLLTGKTIGTKTSKVVQTFDRDYMGERRWKRRKVIGFIIISILAIICSVLVAINPTSEGMETYNLLPFIGSWLGFNTGEIFRIKKLK